MHKLSLFAAIVIGIACCGYAQDAQQIDFDIARRLLQRERAGQTLTPEEQAYLTRAKELRRNQQQQTPRQRPSSQRSAPERLIPLTDMTQEERYEGQDGGLYGGGSNDLPESIQKAALAATNRIQPLNREGNPLPEGVIGLISISMSNATQEFSVFKQMADALPEKSPQLKIVDCAQGGQAMAQWVPADGRPWQEAERRLAAAGVDPNQVQVAWIKLANVAPTGSLEEHGRKLESDTVRVLQNAKQKFPNLQIAYLGSRIWAGNAKGGLNPEPYAYESGFAVRWLIQRQDKGDTELSLDGSPLLLWGPYLWAEGERGRKMDDLVWEPADFAADGVHPSMSGRRKVATQLLDFFTTDALATTWFTTQTQE